MQTQQQQQVSFSAQEEAGISPLNNYMVIRKSCITEYTDYKIESARSREEALKQLILGNVFIESSVDPKLSTTFNDDRLLVQRTQLFDYYIIAISIVGMI